MKIPFKSIAMICGFTATVFCFFHPIVATAITAVFLVHRRVMRKGREVPEMLPIPLKPATTTNDEDHRINPATGLPMFGLVDIKGNPYGFSSSFHND